MKKTNKLKKLTLNKSALRVLTAYDLRDVVGGTSASAVTCNAGCNTGSAQSLCTAINQEE